MELYPLIFSRFTICLKFQLTKTSALFIVAKAICWQSARLVIPTTFSAIYLSERSLASLVNSTLSIKLTGNDS